MQDCDGPRHVVLGVSHVALGLQHDVAPPQRCQNCPKGGKKSAPRRIGPPPCRVGPPTRRGSASKASKQPKREENECAMSYWASAMSRWASNATWLQLKGSKTPKKRVKRAHHVALGPRHVVLNLQRDVALAQRVQNSPKRSKKSAPRRIGSPPCRVGPPTRHGSSSKAAKLLKREPNECATSHWGPCHVALELQRDVAPPPRHQNSQKVSQKRAPCRIGPPPCLVRPPTRRGSPTSDSIIL